NAGTGLWCDIGCQDVTFAGNRVHDNLDAGVLFEISDGATIRNNVLWNNGWGLDRNWVGGIVISTSADAEVSANTVAWNAAGIVVVEQVRGDSVPVHDVRIHDNSIIAADGTTGLSWQAPTLGRGLLATTADNRGARNRYW